MGPDHGYMAAVVWQGPSVLGEEDLFVGVSCFYDGSAEAHVYLALISIILPASSLALKKE